MRRISGASIAWFGVAATMFAAAIALTMTVTWVRGGTLERGRGAAPSLPRQYVGVLLPRDEAEQTSHLHIMYRERVADEDAEVTFSLLGPVTAVLLVSGLQAEDSCGVLVDIAADEREPLDSYDLGPISGDHHLHGVIVELAESQLVSCRVRAVSLADTFTTRRMWMEAADERIVTQADDSPGNQARQAFIEAVREADLQAPLAIRVDVDAIEGAENMRFTGSFETSDDVYGGTWRTLTHTEFMVVSWEDIYRKQLRDVLLIVIGTLIGVGVTVLIEGLRPLVESIGRTSPPTPLATEVEPWPEPSHAPTSDPVFAEATTAVTEDNPLRGSSATPADSS